MFDFLMSRKERALQSKRDWDLGCYIAFGKKQVYEDNKSWPEWRMNINYDDSTKEYSKVADKMIWRLGVLKEDSQKMVTLLSEGAVKFFNFHPNKSDGTWVISPLRDWLCSDNGFMACFTQEEKAKLLGYSSSWNWENPPSEGDKAFILNGGGSWSHDWSGDASREQQLNDFVRSYNTDTDDNFLDKRCMNCCYWTRTIEPNSPWMVWSVERDGKYYENNIGDDTKFGIRPAIKIDTTQFRILSGEGTFKKPYIIA